MLTVFQIISLYILSFASVIFFLIYLIYITKFKYIIEVTRNIPSPPTLPLIGHAHHLLGTASDKNLRTLFDFVQIYGTRFKLWIGPELTIVLVDPLDVEEVLNNVRFNDKSSQYSVLKPWLKGGLLVSGGQKWHQRRKILTPGFHFQILKQFVDIFEKLSRVFLQNLEMEYRRQTAEGFDLHKWVDLCALDVMCETAMGVSMNAQLNAESEYTQALQIMRKTLHKRMFDMIYHFDFTYQFTGLSRECTKALAILHDFSAKVILKRREELLRMKNSPPAQRETETPKGSKAIKDRMVFMDILLHAEIDGKPLSDEDICEEVNTFMFEGHDAPTGGALFTAYNLARHPECQRKCVEEIVAVIGKDGTKPLSYEDLNKLQYLEQCIKESLRMFPSVPLIGRNVTEECEINGIRIPAGTNICIPIVVMGRQKDIFPDPQQFKPERFDYDEQKINPFAYIPFSAGSRNCIGQKFGMLELKTLLANTLRYYELEYVGEPEKPLPLIAELVLRPKEKLMFKLKPRVL